MERCGCKPGRCIEGTGWVRSEDLPKGPNGKALCRYCGTEVEGKRLTFCSGHRQTFHRDGTVLLPGDGCVHEWCIRSNAGYARRCVWARDHGVCAACGVVSSRRDGSAWQADHIVPVAEGGGSCGLEGLRTLCRLCHQSATSALRKRLAKLRSETRV